MTTHANDLPSGACVVCGLSDCRTIHPTYDPDNPLLIYKRHPPVQGPPAEPAPRPPRRGENRMRHLEADTAHHSSESEPS